MIRGSAFAAPEPRSRPDRLFAALLECMYCASRRIAGIGRGEYMILRREGTVSFDCPLCGRCSTHRLVRLVPETL